VLALAAGCAGSSEGAPGPTGTPRGTTSPTASPSPTPTETPPALELQPLGTFASPVWVGPAPGDPTHLYLVERGGSILTLDAQGNRQGVLLDLHGKVSGGNEQGLLSMAFDPAYPRVPRIYVDYTDVDGNTVVARYDVVRGEAVNPTQLLSVAQPYENHNGGLVLFDRTGMLLVGLGDGGNAGDPENRAQDLASYLGKILRIDPATGAPAKGNPYPSNRYVWALGLRNPWRFTFDANGDLYLGDAGQKSEEELDVVPPSLQRGANYGWSVYEGVTRFKEDQVLTPGGSLVVPALTYLHSAGACSIVVGSVYRGSAIPELAGRLLYGDYCAGRLLATTRTAKGLSDPLDLDLRAEGLQAFGVDPRGEILVLTVDKLSRLVPGA
jgi:glucose/arabinose dehydrogenase